MNREIKFRAYDKEDERMRYFDDEDYLYHYPFILRLEQVFKKDSNYDDYEDFEYKDVTDKIELMQYTGLDDKKGKKIYEGDIVKFRLKTCREEYPDLIGYIEYQTTFTAFRIMSNKGSFKIDVLDLKFIEVIGNIYDNPELLGGMNGI